jgi:hypothetical protein
MGIWLVIADLDLWDMTTKHQSSSLVKWNLELEASDRGSSPNMKIEKFGANCKLGIISQTQIANAF